MLKKGIIKNYKCGWCGFGFQKEVIYDGSSKKRAYSTPVVCPKCARTIPTWKKESTGNIVGRTHIHPDRR